MKGRGGGGAEGVSYLSSMEGGLSSVGGRSSFRRRIGTIIRSSALGSACSLTARNVSEAVQEPVFVSSRRLSSGDFRRLERVPSLPSSTASTAISSTGNAGADPRRGLLMPRHRRSHSSGSAPGVDVPGGGLAVDLGVCRPVRKDTRVTEVEGRRPVRPRPPPALLLMPRVGRTLKQAGGLDLNGKKQPPPAPTEASSNGSHNDNANKLPGSAAAAKKMKKKGKARAPAGLRLSSNPYGFTSSSSGESDADVGGERDALFSTDGDDGEEGEDCDVTGVIRRRRREDETETLFSSSRSFSSDSTTAGVESYYYRSSRSNSSSIGRRRKTKTQKRQQLVGVGRYSTVEGGGAIGSGGGSSRAGSMRLDIDEGFRPLVSLSSSITAAAAATTSSTATVAATLDTAACSSATTSVTSSASTSSPSPPLSENKEGEEELVAGVSGPHAPQKQKLHQQAGYVDEKDKIRGMSTCDLWKKDPPINAAGEASTATAGGDEDDEDEEDGYAVEKESSDPYSDFRNSALEMIMERQLFGAGELERLLGAFLSLNSPSHHPVILHVFSEIWQALFDNS